MTASLVLRRRFSLLAAGLEVHAGCVTACTRIAKADQVIYEHLAVPTTMRGLLALDEWLTAHGCTHVAMEATGVYWKPVWHVIEGHLTLVLANAMHIRNVPGRKSDMNDRRPAPTRPDPQQLRS